MRTLGAVGRGDASVASDGPLPFAATSLEKRRICCFNEVIGWCNNRRANSNHAQNGGAVGAIWRLRLIEAARRNCHDHDCGPNKRDAKMRIASSQSLGLGMAEPEIATHRKR